MTGFLIFEERERVWGFLMAGLYCCRPVLPWFSQMLEISFIMLKTSPN